MFLHIFCCFLYAIPDGIIRFQRLLIHAVLYNLSHNLTDLLHIHCSDSSICHFPQFLHILNLFFSLLPKILFLYDIDKTHHCLPYFQVCPSVFFCPAKTDLLKNKPLHTLLVIIFHTVMDFSYMCLGNPAFNLCIFFCRLFSGFYDYTFLSEASEHHTGNILYICFSYIFCRIFMLRFHNCDRALCCDCKIINDLQSKILYKRIFFLQNDQKFIGTVNMVKDHDLFSTDFLQTLLHRKRKKIDIISIQLHQLPQIMDFYQDQACTCKLHMSCPYHIHVSGSYSGIQKLGILTVLNKG